LDGTRARRILQEEEKEVGSKPTRNIAGRVAGKCDGPKGFGETKVPEKVNQPLLLKTQLIYTDLPLPTFIEDHLHHIQAFHLS
jgi:hypothetical protein